MKRQNLLKLCLLLFFETQASRATDLFYNKVVNLDVPDGSTSGLVSSIDVPEIGTINSVSISLNIEIPAGQIGFLGDIYAYLQHGNDRAILLNRPGRSATSTAGYDDNVAMSVTFNDTAINGDIHNYRLTLKGDHTIPLTAPLTGLWQPDGRAFNPDFVLASDPRGAMLSNFTGKDSEGPWTLFIADVSAGANVHITDWTFNADITFVPEPSFGALVAILALTFLTRRERGVRRSG